MEQEITSLACENSDAIRDQFALLQGQVEMMNDIMTMYFTILSAFIAAIYFSGPSLSRSQLFLLLSLYGIAMLSMTFSYWGAHLMGIRHFEELVLLDPSIPTQLIWTPNAVLLALGLQVAMLMASLTFVWSARRRSNR